MNERSTEREGACWEGVEKETSPDQFACMPACSWNTWVCGIRVRTEVMGLDPPQSVPTSQVPAEGEGKFTCTWKAHH